MMPPPTKPPPPLPPPLPLATPPGAARSKPPPAPRVPKPGGGLSVAELARLVEDQLKSSPNLKEAPPPPLGISY